MSKDGSTVTITAKGKSVTMDADAFAAGDTPQEADDLLADVVADAMHLTQEELESGPDFRLGATLIKAHVDYHSNGNTFVLAFEAGAHYAGELVDFPDGLNVTFDKLALGEGATINGIAVGKDADGNKHLRFRLIFPQSEVRKTRGRVFDIVGTYGLLILERMQQTLRLEDGRDIDLTKRAE